MRPIIALLIVASLLPAQSIIGVPNVSNTYLSTQQTTAAYLIGRIAAFDTTYIRPHDPTTPTSMQFCAELTSADTYYNLAQPGYIAASIVPQLAGFKALGLTCVKWLLHYPELDPGFFTWHLSSPGQAVCTGTTAQCTTTLAQQTAAVNTILADIAADGLWVDIQSIVWGQGTSGSTADPWYVKGWYDLQPGYNIYTTQTNACPSTNATYCGYEAGMVAMGQTLANMAIVSGSPIRVLTGIAEPDGEGNKSDQAWLSYTNCPIGNSTCDWTVNSLALHSAVLSAINAIIPSPHTNIKTSMGVPTFAGTTEISTLTPAWLALTGLDYFTIHIHNIDNCTTDNLTSLNTIQGLVNSYNSGHSSTAKVIVANETSVYLISNYESCTVPLNTPQTETRRWLTQFVPVDRLFMSMIVRYAWQHNWGYTSWGYGDAFFYTIAPNNCINVSPNYCDAIGTSGMNSALAATPITFSDRAYDFLRIKGTGF